LYKHELEAMFGYEISTGGQDRRPSYLLLGRFKQTGLFRKPDQAGY
jgi:hypothetical protein